METTKEDKPLESSGEEKAATEKTTKKMGEIPKSNTDDSGDIVLVEAEDLDQPQAVQIVSIGTAEDGTCSF